MKLYEHESKVIFKKHGIPVPRGMVIHKREDVAQAAETLIKDTGSNILVITGKTFGITNVIALDSERNVIQDQRVIVQRDEVSAVNLFRAEGRYSYSCAPVCSSSYTIGDQPDYFEMLTKHNKDKIGFSNGVSEGVDNQQGGQ